MLANHEKIYTASEPWILLPLIYTTIENGAYAEYSHRASTEAISEFAQELPNGSIEYTEALRNLALNLYTRASKNKPGSQYFIDKTPRYHLIAKEIIKMFPDAKFIFLWRNPLSIVASIIETFGRGSWQLYDYKVDLFDGLANLIDCHSKYSDRAISIRFEDLITDPVEHTNKILKYIGLPTNSLDVSSFATVKLRGNMGDPTGVKNYNSISTEPINKWSNALNNPLRINWAYRYINWIGKKRLSYIGYNYQELYTALRNQPFKLKNAGSDFLRILYGFMQNAFELRIIENKFKKIRNWRNTHGHT